MLSPLMSLMRLPISIEAKAIDLNVMNRRKKERFYLHHVSCILLHYVAPHWRFPFA